MRFLIDKAVKQESLIVCKHVHILLPLTFLLYTLYRNTYQQGSLLLQSLNFENRETFTLLKSIL